MTTGAGGFCLGPGCLGAASSCMYWEIRNIVHFPKENRVLEGRLGGWALTWIKAQPIRCREPGQAAVRRVEKVAFSPSFLRSASGDHRSFAPRACGWHELCVFGLYCIFRGAREALCTALDACARSVENSCSTRLAAMAGVMGIGGVARLSGCRFGKVLFEVAFRIKAARLCARRSRSRSQLHAR
jgi:hypothetical protein